MDTLYPQPIREDSLINHATGAGVAKYDPNQSWEISWQNVRSLNRYQQTALCSIGLMRKVVYTLPKAACRKWGTVTLDGGDPQDIEELNRALLRIPVIDTKRQRRGGGFKSAISLALGLAFKTGNGAIILDADDGRPLYEPLDLKNFRKIKSLRVASRWHITPYFYNSQGGSYSHYQIFGQGLYSPGDEFSSPGTVIHRSRVFWFSGIEEDEWHLPDNRTLKVTRQRHPMGGLLILFKDITSELNLRTKYNAMIKTQGKTLDSLHEAVVVFGTDGRLKLWNSAFAELWGVEEDLLKDEPDYDDIADFCVPLFHDRATWKAIKGHITDPSARQETTGEMKRSDGAILTYVTKPLPDGNTLIAFADVSAQRSVETALRDRAEAFETADRLKTEFVKNVSYQLRSPLQTILGYGEFLQMERIGDLNDAQRDKVDAICEASNHLNDLIGNILDLAMIEAGRMDLDITEVDLKALIKEAVSIGVTNAADTEVEVVSNIEKDLGKIEADEKRIRQILFNLISNALRFTDPGGKVTISAERMGDTAKLTVKDNGRGIPAEDQATRFDSFTSSDRRGAGLGLSLVKHFVQLHGGNVGIKSQPGGGTEVVCWIPVEVTPKGGSGSPEKLAA